MFKTLINIFRVPELRNKVLFTLFMLAIYRIGYHVPLPGVDQDAFKKIADAQKQSGDDSAASRIAQYVSLFSGGTLSQSTIFGLGVMPFISASIIFQLLGTVVPSLEKLQKEGETGRKKIQEWTRYATIPLCIIQAAFWITYMRSTRPPLVQTEFMYNSPTLFWVMSVFSLTAGCVFLMWLGEQIDEYGLGNGVSLIILAGIVGRMPSAIFMLWQQTSVSGDASRPITPGRIDPDRFVHLHRRRLDTDHAGPAANPRSAGQAHPRPSRVRRDQAVPSAPRQPRRRNADHLRPVAHALPGRTVRLAAWASTE